MLDNGTKRRIDTARDILVGKVPDPKSQVEQITIALIYKFMDDMDAESEELGGSRKFFAGRFTRYGWAKLMRSGLGGHETLNLYAEGIAKIPENPGIPLLFRDIFKNAYLPYRDPETLRAFLKVIDEFEYDHSERLGDAFEYLLSVLGSQGEAGQFRTPRHIIDFIVKIVDPKKNESILDPACGTAGFLISSYKHILRANADAKGNSTLTPDERGRLAKNLKGYDISPDMVRLSLVNMYLHGFADPHIYEYDTLTSEEKWNEYADVILANPPFMSPKGGIRPHNRFSVQSRRSEVLFVDYMAEHLTPNGRAGIIVPEGIIFQSQTAYKQLRKMLVEEYLVAVVSLPAGVFNPYSGVKTSILILDKSLAKKINTIGFFKVENDGFGLGAQRRPIDKNDLPRVQAEVSEYLHHLRTGKFLGDFKPMIGQIVDKAKITANGEYNLSGERYRENGSTISDWPMEELGEIFDITSSKRVFQSEWRNEGVPFYRAREIIALAKQGFVQNKLFISEEMFAEYSTKYGAPQLGDMMVTGVGTLGVCYVVREGDRFYFKDGNIIWLKKKTDNETEYVRLMFQTDHMKRQINQAAGATVGTFTIVTAKKTKIPLPPLEVQKEIVAEIEGYQKVIDGARAVIDNYRPHIPIAPDWPRAELGKICETIQNGYPVEQTDEMSKYRVTRIQTIANGFVDLEKTKWTENDVPKDRFMRSGDILFSHINSIDHLAKTAIFKDSDVPVVHGINLIRLRPKTNDVNPLFLLLSMKQTWFIETAKSYAQRAVNQASIKASDIRRMTIALPLLATQKAIVAEIEAEQALVNANRELIARFEKKIQNTLARIWGKNKSA